MTRDVTVYTQPGCPPCRAVKEYLSRKGVPFTERDISRDAAAVEDLRRMRAMATPVIVIDGAPITGFDQARLDEMLDDSPTAKAA